MAHRLEHRAVRGDRHHAVGGVRALRRATLGLILLVAAATARAEAPPAGRGDLLGSGAWNVPAWWSMLGRAGWSADRDLGSASAWSLAGLARGAWSIEVPGGTPDDMPYPGTPGAVRPLLWFDSLTVVSGSGAGVRGFDATLARVGAGPDLIDLAGTRGRPTTDLVLASGANGLGDNALAISRSDTLSALRAEAASGNRGPIGSFAGAGRDLYGVAGALVRGRHRFEGAFDHRRINAELTGGEFETVRGEGGGAGYRYHGASWTLDARAARAYDRHISGGGPWGDLTRLADATTASLQVERGDSAGVVGARGSWRAARIRPAASDSGAVRAREAWGAVFASRGSRLGRIEAELGIGHQGTLGRTVFAPSVAWSVGGPKWNGRVFAERVVTPIWSDLAPGVAPFLQNTWAGGIDLAASAGAVRASGGVLAGRTNERAVISRVPLEAIALRSGFGVDPDDYTFTLLHGETRWAGRHAGAGIAGFGLVRASGTVPAVDPGYGLRAIVEAGVSMFQGDLKVHPMLEAAGIGARTSEAGTNLAGFVTWTARLELALGDAVVLIEGRNLEDRNRPQTWIDSATGVEATGPGRELRSTFSWRLWD